MAHFPATSDLFEDLKSFQKADFEAFWNYINESNELSDEDKALFTNTEEMNSNPIFTSNPLLTSAALAEDIVPNSSSVSLMNIDDYAYDLNEQILNSDDLQVILAEGPGNPVIDLPTIEEENETVMPSPTTEIPTEIFEIHSYSKPEPSTSKSEIVAPKPAPVKSKGKTGPPAVVPKVQKEKEVLKKVQNGRVNKRKRKPVRRFDESSDDDSDYEVPAPRKRNKSNSTSKSSSNNSNRKVKLYEQGRFDDPDMERCRQNAINAKINRDRKNKEKNAMQKEMNKLKDENQNLKKKNNKYRQRLSSFEARLQLLESVIRSNPQMAETIKSSGNADFVSKSINIDEMSSSDEDDQNKVIYYDS